MLPGWRVEGATLAAAGSLGSAIQALADPQPLVYPMFMSDGWFASTRLPELTAGILGEPAEIFAPLGTEPALHALCAETACRAAATMGAAPGEASVLLAAHGSPSDARPGAVARRAARRIEETGHFREVRVGFIDQAPGLAEAARMDGPALCLPFFASRAGHVQDDVPRALAEAAFAGPILDPVGLWPAVPELIARSLAAHAERIAA